MGAKTHEESLKKWATMITDEINNPLTVAVELTRAMDYDKSFPEPLTTLTIKIKQYQFKEELSNL